MDRYQRVEKPRPESAIQENEIRITGQGLIRNYVGYATSLLQERGMREIVLKAMGQAISKTVTLAEIIKKTFPGLHQDTSISSVSITDVWEPIEEGLVPLETTRNVSMISITLSTRELNRDSPGYQAPFYVEQPQQQQRIHHSQQQHHQSRQSQAEFYEDSYGRGRGRGRGIGRGRGRDWGRGAYGGYQGGYGGYDYNQGGYDYNQGGYGGYNYNQGGYGRYGSNQENGGWNSGWGRGRGRGRGNWGYHDAGYEQGRGGNGVPGGRSYVRGRGRMGRMGGRGRGNHE